MATFTKKQMGDACEMIVAAELTLAGVPALKVPDNWPHYDVIAQPPEGSPQRVSVKGRTYKTGNNYVGYWAADQFEWLAAVIFSPSDQRDRTIYLIPRAVVEKFARGVETNDTRRWVRIDRLESHFAEFKDNFCLSVEGSKT